MKTEEQIEQLHSALEYEKKEMNRLYTENESLFHKNMALEKKLYAAYDFIRVTLNDREAVRRLSGADQ